jgi:hypothetical protein
MLFVLTGPPGELAAAMVDHLVTKEQAAQIVVPAVLTGVERGPSFTVSVNLVLNRVDVLRCQNLGVPRTAVLPTDSRPALRFLHSCLFFSLPLMKVDIIGWFARLRQSAQHKPRRLLSHADLFGNLESGYCRVALRESGNLGGGSLVNREAMLRSERASG